jgi:hypothetical protein
MNAFRSPPILLFDYTHRYSIRLAHLSGFLVVPNAVGTGFLPSSSTRLGSDLVVYLRHASPQVVHHD